MSLKYRIIPVTPFQQNCSLIWCEETRKGAVVDPGGDLDKIRSAISEEHVEVEKIVLTHAHIDHAGGTAELARALSLPVEGPHKDDNFWIQGLPQQAQMFGFPVPEVFTPDRWLNDGEQVTVGNQSLDVLHCPGHTPGHVVLFHKPSGLALVGDVIFHGSIGRTDFPKGDHATLIQSIRGKLFPLGDEIAFIPGHGPMSTFGQERATNPFVSDHRG
ncbi:MAG: MBL fold metallo-hydrolase [Gammaproteobacteria bacterium]|uniref:Metal-binding enzyme n=1 Tax=Marinobacter nitratireducens TaxID=1137280 RepID=A0A072N2K6_9GAMM|nr:MBL fold metallo-hydrolase [Marinobacter nitratireducens]KEF31721.1 Putative metal-binding enzyme [Marinobacter nitratireducens]TNE75087.1 MAG: MBL fold metallo-hydrolase [Gammaproteobacteria bacterium]TNE94571.1 MAG: MBL fold metallo-hydrolase [Gammaproteobacteria bacterium]